jgi:hypothetical protein
VRPLLGLGDALDTAGRCHVRLLRQDDGPYGGIGRALRDREAETAKVLVSGLNIPAIGQQQPGPRTGKTRQKRIEVRTKQIAYPLEGTNRVEVLRQREHASGMSGRPRRCQPKRLLAQPDRIVARTPKKGGRRGLTENGGGAGVRARGRHREVPRLERLAADHAREGEVQVPARPCAGVPNFSGREQRMCRMHTVAVDPYQPCRQQRAAGTPGGSPARLARRHAH